jgi:hypothetical protein
MLDGLQLRTNIVLVLLAPNPEQQRTPAGLIVERAIAPVTCYGRVLRTGPRVMDVARGDVVAFPPSAGEPYDYGDFQLLFLREPEIAFIVPKDKTES